MLPFSAIIKMCDFLISVYTDYAVSEDVDSNFHYYHYYNHI